MEIEKIKEIGKIVDSWVKDELSEEYNEDGYKFLDCRKEDIKNLKKRLKDGLK